MIALADCNNFYVSCERKLDPSLNGKPVVVLSNNDGVVISRSNEVKALGVTMAGPSFRYRELFEKHRVKVFSANFNYYMQISEQVMTIVREYSPRIEVYSVDEAFIDLRGMEWKQPAEYLREMRQRIWEEVGIPVSVGIAETKTLAKVAAEFCKKDASLGGVMNLAGDPRRNQYLRTLPVRDLWGVGRQFGAFLEEQNIKTALDLVRQPDEWTLRHLHIGGLKMVWELRGTPCIPVEANLAPPKQIMRSRSFGRRIESLGELKEAAALYTSMAAESLRAHKLVAGVAGVFMHTNHFNKDPKYSNALADALDDPTSYTPALIAHVHRLLEAIYREGYRYQKLGVTLTDLGPADTMQLSFTYDAPTLRRQEAVMGALDKLNAKYRKNHLVVLAAEGIEHPWHSKQDFLSAAKAIYVDPAERTRFMTTVSAEEPKARPQIKKQRHGPDPAMQSRALGKQVAERLMAGT